MVRKVQRTAITATLAMALLSLLTACGGTESPTSTPVVSAPTSTTAQAQDTATSASTAAPGTAVTAPTATSGPSTVGGTGAGGTLNVWLFKSFVPAANDVLVKQIQDWGTTKDVKVDVTFYTAAEQRQKFVTAIEGGTAPDIGEVDPTGPLRYANALVDLTDLTKEIADTNGGILPVIEPYVKFGDKYLGVPRYSQQNVFFVRKDLLDAKGQKIPTSWDELKQVARAVQDPSKNLYGFGQTLNPSTDGNVFAQVMLWDFGAGAFDNEGKAAFNTPAAKQAMQYMTDLVGKEGIEPPGVNGWTDSSNNESYLSGQIAMTFNGAGLYYAMNNSKDQKVIDTIAKNTVLAPWPAGPAGAFTVANPNSWVVFNTTKNGDLAKDLIRYLEDDKQFSEYVKASSGMAAPVYQNRFNDPVWTTDPNFDAVLWSLRNSHSFGYPGPVSQSAIEVEGRNLITKAASSIISGGNTVDQALEDANKQIQDVVESSKEP